MAVPEIGSLYIKKPVMPNPIIISLIGLKKGTVFLNCVNMVPTSPMVG